MGSFSSSYLRGSLPPMISLSAIWLCSFIGAFSQKMEDSTQSNIISKFVISEPPTGLFGPIEVSPMVVPHNPSPVGTQSPIFPSIPTTYKPALTGRCPSNFSDMESIFEKTASDCSALIATFVGNVICCPQVTSLLHIFQGSYNHNSSLLVIKNTSVDDCFIDLMNILTSRGAYGTIPTLCSLKSENLTGGSCPVRDIETFEKNVNTSRLIDACSTVDPLKECCRPTCQPAVTEAALRISLLESSVFENSRAPGSAPALNALSDCKRVVYAWLARKLSIDSANSAFRILGSCKVNNVCPLDFKYPTSVIQTCRNVSSPDKSCCTSLNAYISEIQKQMLITNRQAINCANQLGSILQKAGVSTNVYELCNVDLKDFSIQANGQQGCLLRSWPADVIYENSTGFTFTCDLNDNIAAPWPISSTLSTLSLCAPEMSLPALPFAQNTGNSGNSRSHLGPLLHIFLYLVFRVFLKCDSAF